MEPAFPAPVPTWHNDIYPAIDPTNPALSQAGKTVIITGAGTGIGRATALAFAAAKAKHIILLGRTMSTLKETLSLIRGAPNASSTKVTIFQASVTDASRINDLVALCTKPPPLLSNNMDAIFQEESNNLREFRAEEVGGENGSEVATGWDVLILNAATAGTPQTEPTALSTSIASIHEIFATNTFPLLTFSAALLPCANVNPVVFNVTSLGAVVPARLSPRIGLYVASKAAAAKLIEVLALENPQVFWASVHPGVVKTKLFENAGLDAEVLPMDGAELAGGFMVWLAAKTGGFAADGREFGLKRDLTGRFLCSNWDVEELEARSGKIGRDENTVTLAGFPYGQVMKL
ncbi:unnamed protein product [Periconia digitata]|uniref:Uncharacterized protein n=1 Tax=Periconia digitata TaxID=1303443 RepID=A0A9W4UIK7_9PLEO|nr:unnamed protein product [Periconia digitata]